MYLVSQHSTGVPPDRLSTQLITIIYFENYDLDLQRKRSTNFDIFYTYMF